MHRCVVHVLVIGVALIAPRAVPAQQDAASIIDKAIKAHGGAQRLAQLNAARATATGTIHAEGLIIPFTTESVSQLPDKLKTKMRVNLQGLQMDMVQVLDGDRGSMTTMGQTQEIPAAMLAELKETLYASKVRTLTPLLRDQGFTITAAKEIKVGGRPAVGIKVAAQGHKDLYLYFDKEGGLLVKSERRGLDSRQNEVFQETLYSNYKDVQGLQSPMRIVSFHDGRKFMEGNVTDLKLFDKLPDSEFAQP